MALLHIDGFDTYDSTTGVIGPIYTDMSSFSGIITGGGRFASSVGYLRLSNTYFCRKSVENHTLIYTGFAVCIASSSYGSNNIVRFEDSAKGIQVAIGLDSAGIISAKRGTTVIGSSDSAKIGLNTWHYVAVEVKIDNSVGYVKVYVDGAEIINVSGVDTQATANAGCDFVTLYGHVNYTYFDDWYIADDSGTTNNTLITEARVVTLVPTADTAQKDFTASTGSDNYAMVDENGIDLDTTYVSTSTSGAKDIYDLGNLPTGVDTVYGVATYAWARKDNTDAVLFDFGVKSGSTESFSTGNVMASDYLGFEHVNNVDPNTSGAWSVSAVNSLQCGFTTTI